MDRDRPRTAIELAVLSQQATRPHVGNLCPTCGADLRGLQFDLSFCDGCAQSVAHILGAEYLRIVAVLKSFPPSLTGPILVALEDGKTPPYAEVKPFIDHVLKTTTERVLPRRGRRRRK